MGKTAETCVLIDSGSQCTLIIIKVARRLELPGRNEKITIRTIKDNGQTVDCRRVLGVSSR